MKKLFCFSLLFSFSSFFLINIASASFQLDPGDFRLEINGVLLDVEAISIIDNIDFSGDTFTVTMSSSQLFSVSSSEKRTFTVSPQANTTRACQTTKSTLIIQTADNTNPVSYTISLGASGSCSSSDSGGAGGAGAGTGAAPAVTLVTPTPVLIPPSPLVTPPTLPPLPVEVAPVLPPIEQPPVEQPLVEKPPEITAELPPPVPPGEIPPATVAQTVEAAQTIGSSAISIGASIGGGVFQIISGLATGQKGSGDIAKNFPNAGIYSWNTGQSLLPDSDSALKKLAEGGDYSVLISSVDFPNVRDISDSYFSFIRPRTAAFLRPRETAYLLENVFPAARAQENQGPSLKIISPNGGEVWDIGGTYDIKWETKNLESGNSVNISIYKEHVFFGTEDALKIAGKINKEVGKAVAELRADKAVVSTVKNIAVPISITVTAASAGAVTITASAGSATVAINISEFLQSLSFARFYLFGLLRFKRRKPWGKITDKLSGQPIASAIVQIYDSEFKKLKDSQTTDKDGRFSALIGIGKYYVTISKPKYETYRSGIIEITSPDQILNLEFYLSVLKEELSLEYLKKISVWSAIKRIIEIINPYLLLLGTFISLIAVVIIPNGLNYTVFIIYLLLDGLKIYFARHLLKPLGKVVDETTNEALALAVVRIFEEDKNWLLATKVTDENGRFNFLLAPGRYYLTFSKAGYQPFNSGTIIIEKGILPPLDIKLKKAQ